MISKLTLRRSAIGIAASLLLVSAAYAAGLGPIPAAPKELNPCAAKTINPCAAKTINPCAAKTLNPCAARTLNPCAAKTLNPCAAKTLNPCAAKTLNPCMARTLNPCKAKSLNPCAAKALNPCAAKKLNPCGAKTLNPCGARVAKNPCNPCGLGNPCNPCGGAAVNPCQFKRPKGAKLVSAPKSDLRSQGEKLWNDRGLGKSGLACASCHINNYMQMNPTFAKPYPHEVAMPRQQAGVDRVHADEMVQFCMVVPMADEPLPWDSTELAALTAYVESIQPGYKPVGGGGVNPCNPCALKNPCSARNPCNPCGR